MIVGCQDCWIVYNNVTVILSVYKNCNWREEKKLLMMIVLQEVNEVVKKMVVMILQTALIVAAASNLLCCPHGFILYFKHMILFYHRNHHWIRLQRETSGKSASMNSCVQHELVIWYYFAFVYCFCNPHVLTCYYHLSRYS